LPGWDLLTSEEKQNFISQINNSEPEQFENICWKAKELIRERQKPSVHETKKKANKS
jgi:hypothetical protein